MQLNTQQGPPMKFGWLQKKSRKVLNPWQWRFFVLYDKKLKYFYHESDKKAAWILNFDQISTQVSFNRNKIILAVLGSNRKYILAGAPTFEMQEWLNCIDQHIRLSLGTQRQIPMRLQQKSYMQIERISEQQFRQMADTGDILLFRGRGIRCRIQRSVTQSNYDHVGMVLIFDSGAIALLEATGADGVSIYLWNDFLSQSWHLFYKRIVMRKLEMPRNDEFMQRLEEFLKQVRGKKFSISLSKLMKLKQNQKPGQENNFFCSELVASAYKSLGLLSEDIPSCNYWPGSFEYGGNMQLLQGKLGDELWIDFNIDSNN